MTYAPRLLLLCAATIGLCTAPLAAQPRTSERALTFGSNHDLLDRAKYRPHAVRSWTGVNGYMMPNGALGQVQRAGDQPLQTARQDRALYASGGERTVPLRAPTAAERIPRATVRFAPDRFDDILWENDRAAFRLYGPALEKREPPSGSGIDAWAKAVRWPFMDRQLKTGTYHNDQGEGLDYYNVRQTRGVGGLGIWHDNKLWVSRNYKTYQILKNGPDVAAFRVDYAPWPVDVSRKVWESRTITLPMGSNLNRIVSTISSDSPAPLIVGIGLGKNATVQGRGTLFTDRARGIMSYWEPTDPAHGSMGTAVIVDPASIVDFASDADNNLVLVRVTPGKPFVYYAGSAWDRGLDFKSRGEWEEYLKTRNSDFNPSR